MSDTSGGVNELDLINIDPDTGKLPPARLKDVKAGLAIYTRLRDADATSAINRARLDAMFDGEAPYDPSVLKTTGQGSRTNLNFGEAQRLLDVDLSAFVDLNTSLDALVQVKLRHGEPAVRLEAADVIGEEATRTFREWPEFHSSYLRLCTEFIKHGAGVVYFADDRGWKFRTTGLGDFLVPRQSPACEDGLEVAASRRSYMLHELYDFIRNPEIAATRGWDVDEVRRVMVQNTTNTTSASKRFGDWEALQRELKNNDLLQGVENTTVSVIHMWVRELDGTFSQYAFAEDNPASFLFEKRKQFKSAEQAFIFFTFGVGNNGTLHSVRGKGQRIFSHIQTSNRLRSQMVDAAFLGSSVMLQPQSERALEKLSYTLYGPYSILSPDVDVIEKVVPNLSQSMQPALDSVESQLARNSDPTSTYGQRASPYRNELGTEHDIAVSSRLTGATMNLFYASWSRLLREMLRRMVTTADKSDPLVKDFYARCEARGVGTDLMKAIDHRATNAVRAIGEGSAANRLLALRELNTIAGGYDETGRHNLRRDITTARVGRDMTDRYMPTLPEPRATTETKIALLENSALLEGREVPVLSSELHGEQMRQHAPALQQMLSGISSGQVDPLAALPGVEALHAHCEAHVGWLSQDGMAEADAAGYRQLLQQSKEIVTNTRRKIEAMQRKAQEEQAAMPEGGQPGQGQEQPNEDTQRKMEAHELSLRMTQEKAQQDMRIKEAKAGQELAITDAKRAMELEGN
tara:strand:- start:469 stop:2709 length:2241 start_codon:yes stop_codon:yes gene_type:complete